MSEMTSEAPKVVLDPQDPLPESNWLFRRILVFVGTGIRSAGVGIVLYLLWKIANQLGNTEGHGTRVLLEIVDGLTKLAVYLIALDLVDRVLYLIAPSAEQATRMIATVRAALGGVSFRKTQTAVSTLSGSSGTTTSTVEAQPNVTSGSGVAVTAGGGANSAGPSTAAIPDLPPNQRR